MLAARQLEDDGPDVRRLGDLEDRARQVERCGADVDGRDGEPGDLAPAAGGIQLLDARRPSAQLLARLPDQPLRCSGSCLVVGEGSGPREIADRAVAERALVVDDQPLAGEMGRRAERAEEVGWRIRDVRHDRGLLKSVRSDHGIGPRAGSRLRAGAGTCLLSNKSIESRRTPSRIVANRARRTPFGLNGRHGATDSADLLFYEHIDPARTQVIPQVTCFVRRPTKSTRTYSPRCSGVA
jgi:hypothetical protein